MKRPFSVAFLGWLFIVVGPAALCYHLVKGRLDFWMIPIALVEITTPDLSCRLNRSMQHHLI